MLETNNFIKNMKEVYVIYSPYYGGYYNEYNKMGSILFAYKYQSYEDAMKVVERILSNSLGKEYLKIEKFYTL
jgi:hypothetical protein